MKASRRPVVRTPKLLPIRPLLALAVPFAGILLSGCTSYYAAPPPPPAGWAGENWAQHVARCERRYPRYDPRTDLIYRRGGTFSCPL
jgi:hypothetical protein